MALVSVVCRTQHIRILLVTLNAIRTAANLSYKIYGEQDVNPDDPPIFLFHGLLGTKKHWESFGKTMMNMTKRLVVAVDLRNHGDSPHVNSHKYDDMSADILKLFEKLSIDRANVVGHGMGGRASMHISLIAPQKIAGLLVVDISPVSTCADLREKFPKIMTTMKEFSFKEQKKVKHGQREVKKKLKPLITDEILMKAILSNVTKKSTGSIGWSCNLDVLIKEFKHIITFPRLKKQYLGPTLFIGGQLSEYLPFAVDLVYKVHGKENYSIAPVIAIHGLLGMKKNWESVSKKINENTSKTVLTVDVRNHGESPHTESHTYPELASDILQLMTKLSIKTSHVVGHSMGGRTGMVLALTEVQYQFKSVNFYSRSLQYSDFQPSKVESLVVVDISPVSTAGILNDFFPKLIQAMRAINFTGVDNINKARTIARDHLASSGLVKPESSGFILMNIGPKQEGTFGWMCNLDALIKHFNDIATFPSDLKGKQYPGNTLFIGGDQSNYLPDDTIVIAQIRQLNCHFSPEDLYGIRNYFPKAELEYVKGAGHNVHAEDPISFLRIVSQFLK
ncbi:unnamed protein product [Leptosia nina]|uniref:sn-1-specific diacylglycerol lipase ABHD11 n=1 Tax=Leptosia nina TaxID=320188 RepID=A0AAV1IWM3_9NEOP